MLQFADIAIGAHGVVSCEVCGLGSGAAAHDLEVVRRSLEDVRVAHPALRNVSFEGFEPFSHAELPSLVEAATRAGFERIRLTTDAGALGLGGNAGGCLAAGVRHVRFVLLGSTAESHDRICGRPGLFESALCGVSALRSAATDVGARVCISALVPVCRHNVEDCPATVARACSLGASAVELEVSGSAATFVELLEAALDTATSNGIGAVVRGWSSAPRVYRDRFERVDR